MAYTGYEVLTLSIGSVNISWYVVDHVYKECVFIQDYGAISFQTDPVKNYEPPLFVVDDVPYQNYDILSFPVTEIEEIFILKGVDAAIYGPKREKRDYRSYHQTK